MRTVRLYHPDIGYYEAVIRDGDDLGEGEVVKTEKDVLANAKVGTILVPPPPRESGYHWVGDTWRKKVDQLTESDVLSLMKNRLDAVAQERGYDNRNTIVTYVNSNVERWAMEAQAFIEWRDSVMAATFQLIEAKQIPQTATSYIEGLPVLDWGI